MDAPNININDVARVSALINQLKASQAWADLEAQQQQIGSDINDGSDSQAASANKKEEIPLDHNRSSVASLLSRLSSTSSSLPLMQTQHPGVSDIEDWPSSESVKVDVKGLTFRESLPHLTNLADVPSFKEAIFKLRQEQIDLERQLWREREGLHLKHLERVKTAITKAKMLNSGMTGHDVQLMKQNFEKELTRFDRERVQTAWTGLITHQQRTLEKLDVPTMFMTDEILDREKQQRIIQVLEGIVTSEENPI